MKLIVDSGSTKLGILLGVFFLFFVDMYLDVPGFPESLCSVHSKIT